MDIVRPRCAGIDIGKRTLTACVITTDARGAPAKQIRTFGTVTSDLLALADWLDAVGVTAVAMESTGSYWKPIWNLLEDRFELLLANAAHLKAVPGRKTDVRDAEWIADLFRHGLLRASFIPPRPERELRELVRYRTTLVRERASEINRLAKVLEGANVKLGSVSTNIGGVSGRAILAALAEGTTDPTVLAELARGRQARLRRGRSHDPGHHLRRPRDRPALPRPRATLLRRPRPRARPSSTHPSPRAARLCGHASTRRRVSQPGSFTRQALRACSRISELPR